MQQQYDLICIVGPTASGKTAFAANLALRMGAEIISGDSRQVYKGMDIGTGKDLEDYEIGGGHIPYHLIDICEPGSKYSIFRYQHDFFKAYFDIKSRGKNVILCGGSGLYIESALKAYKLLDVPPNHELRENLRGKSIEELREILSSFKKLHNKTDLDSPQRAIRAIEIETFYAHNAPDVNEYEPLNPLMICLDLDRDLRRRRISERLDARLAVGMVEEIKNLLSSGVSAEDLIYYGLEYKYVTEYVIGRITYQEMHDRLEIAIHQFAKRQMTWFRGMERRGFVLHYMDATMQMEHKVEQVLNMWSSL